MARLARKRHLRHSLFDRTERSKHLRAFLAERAAALENTGASFTFTASGVPVPEVPAVAATGTLALSQTPTAADTVTVGEVTYTFVASDADPAAYEVLTGASATDAAENLADAINGEVEDMPAHPDVTAEAATGTLTATAAVAGAAGNAVATTAVLDAADDWAAATLEDGADLVPAVPGTGVCTAADHGLEVGEGPFLASAGTTLPGGMADDQLYWVESVPTANTFTLTARRGEAVLAFTDAGTGTLTLVKADSDPAIYEYLRQNAPEVVLEADDVDDL